jgi:hypothetical protein
MREKHLIAASRRSRSRHVFHRKKKGRGRKPPESRSRSRSGVLVRAGAWFDQVKASNPQLLFGVTRRFFDALIQDYAEGLWTQRQNRRWTNSKSSSSGSEPLDRKLVGEVDPGDFDWDPVPVLRRFYSEPKVRLIMNLLNRELITEEERIFM